VLKGHITQAEGGHLARVHTDQMVLEVIRWGRLVLVIGIEAKSLRTSSRDHQARVYSDQMVLMMADLKGHILVSGG
jgi:hypothetical protein